MFEESEHPRKSDGTFKKKYGADDAFTGKEFRQNTSYAEILARTERNYDTDASNKQVDFILSSRERAVLKHEVFRKNAMQKGRVKPINYAYTYDHFYVYSTKGYDNFSILKIYNIEHDREEINRFLKYFGE